MQPIRHLHIYLQNIIMKKAVLILLVALNFWACKKATDGTNPSPINGKLISKGNLYGAGQEGITKQNLVITTAQQWNTLIAQMDAVNKVSDGFTEVSIDFTKYQVIAAFDDVKGSGGQGLDLTIAAEPTQIVVTVKPSTPQGNVTTVITQPYHIVKIPVSNLPVVFQ